MSGKMNGAQQFATPNSGFIDWGSDSDDDLSSEASATEEHLNPAPNPLQRQEATRNFGSFIHDEEESKQTEVLASAHLRDIEEGNISLVEHYPQTPVKQQEVAQEIEEYKLSPSNVSTVASTNSEEQEHSSTVSPIHVRNQLFSNPDKVIKLLPELFTRNYNLVVMNKLPKKFYFGYDTKTIITPEGLFQLDPEYKVRKIPGPHYPFQLKLSVDDLKNLELNNLVELATDIDNADLQNNIQLTPEKLKQIEHAVRANSGHSVTGYYINEEVFLFVTSLGQCEYPPSSDSIHRKLLEGINTPIVKDISLSLGAATQFYLLVNYLLIVYFAYDNKSAEIYYDFFVRYMAWYVAGIGSIFFIDIGLLRSDCINKEWIEKKIERIKTIQESMIGSAQNWMTYTPLILPPNVIGIGFLPALAYGFNQGRTSKENELDSSILNISNQPLLKTIFNSIGYASTAGSFCSFGLGFVINSISFFFKDPDDTSVWNAFYRDVALVQYTIFVFVLLSQLARYHQLPFQCQMGGRYASNIMNGISYSLLDNGTIYLTASFVFELLFGNYISPRAKGELAVVFGVQSLIILYAFITKFSMTRDLPEYSTETRIDEKSLCTIVDEKVSIVKVQFNRLAQSTLLLFNRPAKIHETKEHGSELTAYNQV